MVLAIHQIFLLTRDWPKYPSVVYCESVNLIGCIIVCYINNSRHLARKYARIFVRGHYLFREANSFPRA